MMLVWDMQTAYDALCYHDNRISHYSIVRQDCMTNKYFIYKVSLAFSLNEDLWRHSLTGVDILEAHEAYW